MNEVAFVQYMECTDRLESRHETRTVVLFCVSANDEHDHTWRSQTVKRKEIFPALDKRFSVEPLGSMQVNVVATHANYELQPFAGTLYGPQQQLYKNDSTETEVGTQQCDVL